MQSCSERGETPKKLYYERSRQCLIRMHTGKSKRRQRVKHSPSSLQWFLLHTWATSVILLTQVWTGAAHSNVWRTLYQPVWSIYETGSLAGVNLPPTTKWLFSNIPVSRIPLWHQLPLAANFIMGNDPSFSPKGIIPSYTTIWCAQSTDLAP